MLEHLGSKVEEFFLCLSDRCYQLFCLSTRLGQCLGVNLTIGGKRHLVELHVGCWHHIVSKLLGQEVAQIVLINYAVGSVVCTQMLYTTNLANLNRLHLYAFVLTNECLNLTQLDTETTQFYLIVNTSKIFYITIGIVAHQIARMIHLTFGKRAISKFLSCQVVTLPVSCSNLRSGHTQLASNTLWCQLTNSIDDESR